MKKITFILGGARSGKSHYALQLAKEYKKVAFIATCQPLDKEMRQRIKKHKIARPGHWQTFDAPDCPQGLLRNIGAKFDMVILDCLTLLLSNLMLKGMSESAIEKKIKGITAALNKIKARSIIVSNEVGLGIVPQNKLARDFRDMAGRMNQLIAKNSDEVYFLVSGIPWRIK